MAHESEKPRITEVHVRMDCNGCVQKIKKALSSVNGISEQYIDFPQQKITIIGWADPEKIVKAIKKTRKSAVICSHTESPDQQPEQSSQGVDGEAQESKIPPSVESANNPQTEPGSTEPPPPPAEPPKDSPPPPSENPKPEVKSPRHVADASASNFEHNNPSRPKDVEEIHVIYHHPPDYGYRYPPQPLSLPPDYGQGYTSQWRSYPSGPGYMPDRYRTTVGPAEPETPSKRYGGQWHSYPTSAGFVPEQPPNQRYGERWHSYPSNARSATTEPPSNPREGRQSPDRYRTTVGSDAPETPSKRYGGQWHSHPTGAGFVPEQPPNQRYGERRHSYPSNARSATTEPSSNPREGRQLHSYHTDSRPPGPELPSQYYSGGPQPRVETQQYYSNGPRPMVETQQYYSGGPQPRVETVQHYSGGPRPRVETQQPVNVTHSYNTYRPLPYVTGYEYVRAPPPYYTNYTEAERYNTEEYHYGNTGNGNVTSIFSDENPNSCTII